MESLEYKFHFSLVLVLGHLTASAIRSKPGPPKRLKPPITRQRFICSLPVVTGF